MVNRKNWLVIPVMLLVFGMTVIGCNDDPKDVPPEEMSEKDRWGWKWDDESKAKIDYSVDDNGVCTINVSGAPDTIWKAHVAYMYTYKAGVSYEYTFEAWTKAGTRDLQVEYFENNDTEVYLGETIQITDARTTYTIYGQSLPAALGENPAVRFQCADQIGTFYVKMLSIKEYTTGKLTITNFSGSPGLTQNMDVYGGANLTNSRIGFFASGRMDESDDGWHQSNITIKGNTIIIPVWEVNWDKKTVVPYTGNTTVAAGDLDLCQWRHTDSWQWTGTDIYINKVPITFTNGNANIDFGTQMELGEVDTP